MQSTYIKFAHEWGFEPIFSSSKRSQGNSFAEKGVGIVKSLLKKNTDVEYALLQYRNAPIPHVGYSPSQLLNSPTVKSRTPVLSSTLQPAVPDSKEIQSKRRNANQASAAYFNRTTRALPPLQPGDPILIKRQLSDSTWKHGKVLEAKSNPRSYQVEESETGTQLHRNRKYLRPIIKPERLIETMLKKKKKKREAC